MNANKVTPQVIEKANQIGREAFKNGEGQVPAMSKELNELMKELELEVGEGGIEIMESFLKGWHDECDEFFFRCQQEL